MKKLFRRAFLMCNKKSVDFMVSTHYPRRKSVKREESRNSMNKIKNQASVRPSVAKRESPQKNLIDECENSISEIKAIR